LNEFELIESFFAANTPARNDVITGIGDDAAILAVPPGQQLVTTTDVLVAGIHFPENTEPEDIGYKSLAVSLSDLAAMGATPAWFTLTLCLPAVDEDWLAAFSRGLFTLARDYELALVGGDTVRGPLVIGVQAHGFVPEGEALLRSGAGVGDTIYISGTLGAAAIGLLTRQGKLDLTVTERQNAQAKLDRPLPRVREALALRACVSACIDISDGLIADLGHILIASDVGARVQLSQVPVDPVCVAHASGDERWRLALTRGDDYELCFTVPPAKQNQFESIADSNPGLYSAIGEIEAAPGLRLVDGNGKIVQLPATGHNHFAHASGC